uniref:NADH dehydrogenase subunit C n=1 Tax=Tridactyle tridactylites TaxID=2174814 RepID=UPI001F136C77|nr:NADH dehydrogenase subunit C [Tridactyle tridactylites]UMO93311.1 NADH dehydrogenase subunit C [Tridactyle tridactylites]
MGFPNNRKRYSYLGICHFWDFREGPEKLSIYESGIEPMGNAWVQFRIRYYMFALVFVVFAVETVFLYPWAMSFDVLDISVFIEVPIVGSVYAWRKGALEWS